MSDPKTPKTSQSRDELDPRERAVHLALLVLIVVASVILVFGALFFAKSPLAFSGSLIVVGSLWRLYVKKVL